MDAIVQGVASMEGSGEGGVFTQGFLQGTSSTIHGHHVCIVRVVIKVRPLLHPNRNAQQGAAASRNTDQSSILRCRPHTFPRSVSGSVVKAAILLLISVSLPRIGISGRFPNVASSCELLVLVVVVSSGHRLPY